MGCLGVQNSHLGVHWGYTLFLYLSNYNRIFFKCTPKTPILATSPRTCSFEAGFSFSLLSSLIVDLLKVDHSQHDPDKNKTSCTALSRINLP